MDYLQVKHFFHSEVVLTELIMSYWLFIQTFSTTQEVSGNPNSSNFWTALQPVNGLTYQLLSLPFILIWPMMPLLLQPFGGRLHFVVVVQNLKFSNYSSCTFCILPNKQSLCRKDQRQFAHPLKRARMKL